MFKGLSQVYFIKPKGIIHSIDVMSDFVTQVHHDYYTIVFSHIDTRSDVLVIIFHYHIAALSRFLDETIKTFHASPHFITKHFDFSLPSIFPLDVRKPVIRVLRASKVSAQSDQRLYYWLIGKYHSKTCSK